MTPETHDYYKGIIYNHIMPRTTITDDGHFLFTGGELVGGYGRVCVNNQRIMVNRVSAIYYHKMEPDSPLITCHIDEICRHPNCWAPGHYRVDTRSENVRDAVKLKTHSCRRPRAHKTHCSTCGVERTPVTFDFSGHCIACRNRRSKEWREKNK
jgi:hypothetical protein